MCHIWSALSPLSKHPWALWSSPRGVPLSLFWGTSILISTAVGTNLHSHQWYRRLPFPTSSPASVVHFLNDGFLTAERQNISAVWISRVVKDAEKFLYFFIYLHYYSETVSRCSALDGFRLTGVCCTLLWSKVRITAPEILKYFYRSFLFVCFHLSRTISLSDSEDFGV